MASGAQAAGEAVQPLSPAGSFPVPGWLDGGVLALCAIGAVSVALRMKAMRRRAARELEQMGREASALRAERDQAAARLAGSEARLACLLATSPDALLFTDRAGRVVSWSDGAIALFQLPRERALGRQISTLFVPLGQQGRIALDAGLRGERAAFEGQVLDARGRCLQLEAGIAPVGDGDALCIVLRDREDRRRAEASLRRVEEELAREVAAREADQRQSSMLLDCALKEARRYGELRERAARADLRRVRAPLGMLSALHNVLAKYGPALPDDVRARVQARISDALGRLADMLDGADAPRAAGTAGPANAEVFLPALRQVDLDACLRAAVDDFRPQAPGREFTVSVAPSGARLTTDERLLRQVLEHLLSNAHKFSPAGAPVQVQAAREDGLVCLFVRDAGGGLSEAEIERLFEPFYRTAAARAVPGAGLGLTIVKNAVELMGGVVMVESEPGEGTTVTVNIPDYEEVDHGR